MKDGVDSKLKEMEHLIDQLIQNAENLREISLQVISRDEMKPLQMKQEELVQQLEKIEEVLKNEKKDEKNGHLHKQIAEKLAKFEKLNANFIENLKAAHGLIRFDNKDTKP